MSRDSSSWENDLILSHEALEHRGLKDEQSPSERPWSPADDKEGVEEAAAGDQLSRAELERERER